MARNNRTPRNCRSCSCEAAICMPMRVSVAGSSTPMTMRSAAAIPRLKSKRGFTASGEAVLCSATRHMMAAMNDSKGASGRMPIQNTSARKARGVMGKNKIV